jgi:hypothetical protein
MGQTHSDLTSGTRSDATPPPWRTSFAANRPASTAIFPPALELISSYLTMYVLVRLHPAAVPPCAYCAYAPKLTTPDPQLWHKLQNHTSRIRPRPVAPRRRHERKQVRKRADLHLRAEQSRGRPATAARSLGQASAVLRREAAVCRLQERPLCLLARDQEADQRALAACQDHGAAHRSDPRLCTARNTTWGGHCLRPRPGGAHTPQDTESMAGPVPSLAFDVRRDPSAAPPRHWFSVDRLQLGCRHILVQAEQGPQLLQLHPSEGRPGW